MQGLHGLNRLTVMCITLESGVVRCGQLVADDGREITLDTPDMGKLILPKVNVIAMEDAPWEREVAAAS